MSTIGFLAQLRALGVRLWLEEDRLRLKAGPGILTDELKQELARRKPEIVAFLGHMQDTSESTHALLLQLHQSGVQLSLDGEKLKVKAAAGVITPELKRMMAEKKEELILFLRRLQPRSTPEGGSPLDPNQLQQWVLQQLVPETLSHHISLVLRGQGKLDRPRFEQTLERLHQRHLLLRCAFESHLGRPSQRFLEEVKPVLFSIDLRNYPYNERENRLKDVLDDESKKQLVLDQAPLLRSTLVLLDDLQFVMVFTFHRIIADQWSLQAFTDDFVDTYEALGQGEVPLVTLDSRYLELFESRRKFYQSSLFREKLASLAKRLEGWPLFFEVPTDHSRGGLISYRAAQTRSQIPENLEFRINKYAQNSGYGPQLILLAAYGVLLHRYSNRDHFLVAMPLPNPHNDAPGLIGRFSNPLVVRVDLAGQPSFEKTLRHLDRELSDLEQYSEILPCQLAEELQHEPDMMSNPICQVKFVYKDPSPRAFQMDNLNFEVLPINFQSALYDLTLRLEKSSGYILEIEYNADLYDPKTIARIQGHFLCLLESCLTDPQRPVRELSYLSEDERQQLLRAWNDTDRAFPESVCLHDLVQQQVQRTPDAVALVCGNERQTYAELNLQAQRLAHHLLAQGVMPGRYVGLFFDACAESIVALLAVLKMGGVYIPLHPLLPKSRLAFILEDTGASCILSLSRLDANLPEFEALRIHLDRIPALPSADPVQEPKASTQAADPAYIIYTPMSTRRPKAVVTTHQALANRMFWLQRHFPLDGSDLMLQRTPLTSGTAANEVFWALTTGAGLVLHPGNAYNNYAALTRFILTEGITVLHLVPYGLEKLLSESLLPACTSLSRVFCGAEPLDSVMIGAFYEKLPNAELINLYGVTEAGGDVSAWRCKPGNHPSIAPIGRPLDNTRIFILDAGLAPVPIGVPGDLYVTGVGLANGYLNRPDITRERFLPNPFHTGESDRMMFKTGDIARFLVDGTIEYLGRVDTQVKVHGLRVNLDEIEASMASYYAIRECAAAFRRDAFGEPRLVAYYVSNDDFPIVVSDLKSYLEQSLPAEILPSVFIRTASLPKTSLGKIDRDQLPVPEEFLTQRSALPRAYSEVERVIARVWREVLNVDKVSVEDNFFALGGNSLQALEVYHRLPELLKRNLAPAHLFQYTTISELGLFLEQQSEEGQATSAKVTQEQEHALLSKWQAAAGCNLAVIGWAGRFPGAENVDQLWQNLCRGQAAMTHFSREQLAEEGVDEDLLDDPYYVTTRAVLSDIKQFDAAFFKMTSREAALTDPQQRILFESCYLALEHAGYADSQKQRVALFAGAGESDYYMRFLHGNARISESVDGRQVQIGNRLDFLASRTAHHLGLRGPALVVQAGSATSMVAIKLAANAIQQNECDLALAGGVWLGEVKKAGYMRHSDRSLAADGQCRPFHVEADGQVPGQGVALVVLKRVVDAIADGDTIHGVIRSLAIEMDPMSHEPNAETWVEVMTAAQRQAALDPATVTYIEANGTGDPTHDQIELQALQRVYGGDRELPRYLGAIRANVGNLEHASTAAALIKLCLTLRAPALPPQSHSDVTMVDPHGALRIASDMVPWPEVELRRGALNVWDRSGYHGHMIVEAPPAQPVAPKFRPWHMLTLSAKSAEALETMTNDLVGYLEADPHADFSDVSYSLNLRPAYKHRRMIVASTAHEAILELKQHNPERVFTRSTLTSARAVTFMFPGQGVQYQNMGRQLYQVEPSFRRTVDRCWAIVGQNAPDLYDNLTQHNRGSNIEKLHQTYVTQPATFITEYALASLLIEWGVRPDYMIGNSLGEYVAATLSGVFSLEDALDLVSTRGRLMQQIPEGRQLAVELSESEVQALLHGELSLAGMAGPSQAMVAGSPSAIDALKKQLDARGVFCYRLFTSHAFHSYMMDPIIEPFREAVGRVALHPPKIPFISTITGTWITDAEAQDPAYWAQQLRQPVRFSKGLEAVFAKSPEQFILEVGPDKQLSTIAIRHPAKSKKQMVFSTMRQPTEEESDCHILLTTLGRLWLNGFPIDWQGFHRERRNRKLPLSAYPFERKEYWLSHPGAWDLAVDNPTVEPVSRVLDEEEFRSVATDLVPPRDELEQEICGYWLQALGLKELGIFDDFFELGGNSLIGVRLVNMLRRKLRVPLANPILLQKRSVAAMSDYIKEIRALATGEGNQNSIIVQLQRGERGSTPLFLFHPIEGDILIYRQLVDFLDPKQLVYAVQARSLLGGEVFTDIPSQAAAYLEDIRRIQPMGPYRLAGFSFGGFLAYEISRLLIESGEKVSLTSMIDSSHPSTIKMSMDSPVEILKFLTGYGVDFPEEEYRGLSHEEQIAYAEARVRAANRASLIPPVFGLEMCRTWFGHQQALNTYIPKPFAGRVLFFNATELMGDAKAGGYYPWLNLVQGGLELHHVPGHHISIMNVADKVKIIAKHFKRALKTA